MSFFINRQIERQGLKEYCYTLPKIFLQVSTIHSFMKKITRLKVSFKLEFEAPKFVIVKAYKRIQNGKVVKVRSYYRCVEGRTVVTARVF